jgi:protein-disulfide isomerase
MNRFYASVGLALLLCAPSGAKDPKDGKDPGITRQQADEILNELRQIRQLLEKQNAGVPKKDEPAHAKINLQGTPMLGSKEAPLTIVEFTDYQCPFCQSFHVRSFPELKKNYIDTGKVRFYSRDLPLADMHSNAMRAAQAARCANDQGQFWKMREVMSATPDRLDLESLISDAKSINLNMAQFASCVQTEKYKDAVQSDVMEAMRIGANGTPTFIVGKSTSEGVDGELMVGALPFVMFDSKLKDLSK